MKFYFTFFAIVCVFLPTVLATRLTSISFEKYQPTLPEENPQQTVTIQNTASRQASVVVQPLSEETTESLRSTFEGAEFALDRFQTGFAKTVETGITVGKGTGGTLKFRIRARGVDAETLSNSDLKFKNAISNTGTTAVVNKYNTARRRFKGGLNVPFLDVLGFNLNTGFDLKQTEATTREVIDEVGVSTYNNVSRIAEDVLSSYTETNLIVKGSLDAVGDSFIPRTVFSFLKFSRVEFGTNESTNVFSTDSNDLIAATSGGRVVPSANAAVEIESPSRR